MPIEDGLVLGGDRETAPVMPHPDAGQDDGQNARALGNREQRRESGNVLLNFVHDFRRSLPYCCASVLKGLVCVCVSAFSYFRPLTESSLCVSMQCHPPQAAFSTHEKAALLTPAYICKRPHYIHHPTLTISCNNKVEQWRGITGL